MPLLQDRGVFLLAMPPLPFDEWLEDITETQGSQFLGSSNLRIKLDGRGGGERLSSSFLSQLLSLVTTISLSLFFVHLPNGLYLAKNGLKQKSDRTKTKALKSEAKLNKSPTRLALIFIHLHMYWLHMCVCAIVCVCVHLPVCAHMCEVIPDML